MKEWKGKEKKGIKKKEAKNKGSIFREMTETGT